MEGGFESSGDAFKIFLSGATKNGPEVNLELGAYESCQGDLKGYVSVNDENLIGQQPEKRDWEMSAKLGPTKGAFIRLNANPTEILSTYKSESFKDRMQNIQQSYSPFTK